MTKEQKKKYLDNGGIKCPYCKSEDISADSGVEVDGGVAYQEVHCLDCDKYWTDIYKLINVKEVQ